MTYWEETLEIPQLRWEDNIKRALKKYGNRIMDVTA
jgi:hypothetical protein